MDPQARTLIKTLIKAGKQQDEIRLELISQGFGSEGLQETYTELASELGVTPPAPQPPAPEPEITPRPKRIQVDTKHTPASTTAGASAPSSNLVLNIIKILGLFLVLGALGVVLSQYRTEIKTMFLGSDVDNGMSAEDIVHTTQLSTMQLAAGRYKNQLLDYGGVCESIGIDARVYTCRENSDAYMIAAPLSGGGVYCVDSTGFAGVVTEEPVGFSCQL